MDKMEAENSLAKITDQMTSLTDDLHKSEDNCKAYQSILFGLNSQIVNALCKPVSEIEKIIFEVEESSKTPREIAEWLKDPINELRENFSLIALNPSKFDNLPQNYNISISCCTAYEDWAARTPVKYDDNKHTCKASPTEYVQIRSRGFIHQDNLHQEKIVKAEVVLCENPDISKSAAKDKSL